jgi:hypothetical protein
MYGASTQASEEVEVDKKEFEARVKARARRFGFLLNNRGLFTWPEVKFVTSDETEILKTLNLKK